MRAAELQLGTELYSVAADPRDDAASVRLLLAQGAEPNWRMPGVGSTPLIAAAGAGCHRVVAALLEAASDVNLSNRSGATAVYAACERGHRLCLKTLLTASPDVEFATHDGATPLGAAASNGDEQMVRLLLDAGADPQAQHSGLTPLQVALARRQPEVARLLYARLPAQVAAEQVLRLHAMPLLPGGRMASGGEQAAALRLQRVARGRLQRRRCAPPTRRDGRASPP